MSHSFEISARRLGWGGECGWGEGGVEGRAAVLIAHGQRNPITVGIDYKTVCVNDFHAVD